jgi:UPF0271 protein
MDIDINSDMGEGFGPYRIGDDEALIDSVSSANVACGSHAGDPVIMTRIVRLAKARGVDIGAHPGLPDLMGFGRRAMQISDDEIVAQVLYQFGALRAIAAAEGMAVTHLSFHAVLGNMANDVPGLADKVLQAAARIDPNLIIYSMPNTETFHAATRLGLHTLTLFLADRAYDVKGALVPRKVAHSVIHDPAKVVGRVRQFLESGTVTSIEGVTLTMPARSILVHSDTPGAAELARMIRGTVEEAGHRVVPTSRLLAGHGAK